MPRTVGHRRLHLPQSQLLSDLYGIILDLTHVLEFCGLLKNAWDASPPDVRLIDALSTACVVRYCRCFEVGLRAKIDHDSIRAVDPRFVEFHDYLFALRQKHLSHSVNEFENNCVVVAVVEAPSPPEVQGVEVMGGRVAGLDRPTASNLEELSRKLLKSAEERYESEKEQLTKLVSTVPLDEIYRLPEPDPFQPDWKRAGKKRKRR